MAARAREGGTVLKAILLDLDDTLLVNPMDLFVKTYLQALAGFLADHVPPEQLVTELLRATQVMAANDGRGPTNEEVFAAAFYPALGRERADLEPLFHRFYAEEFPKLKRITRPAPEGRAIVRWAFDRDLQVAIATNPLFPRTAIEQRLDWAGVGADEFPYSLVTTYEDMHAAKQNPAYYREILGRLGREPQECLMVGDNWEWDVAPTTAMGMRAWWVSGDGAEPPSRALPLLGHGSLGDLWAHIRAGGLDVELS